MAMKVSEIQDWLNTLDEDDVVGIDESGLTLVSASDPEAFLEVGGMPEEDDLEPMEEEGVEEVY